EFIATTTTADLIFQRADATSTNLLFYLDNVKVEEIGESYRFGFQGQEKDDEVKGNGNHYDYGMRMYDPRIGRPLSIDPLTAQYPELSPYQFFSNNPIWFIDLDGLEGVQYLETMKMKDGTTVTKRIVEVDIFVATSKNVKSIHYKSADLPTIESNLKSEYNKGFKDASGNTVEFRFNVQEFDADATTPIDKAKQLRRDPNNVVKAKDGSMALKGFVLERGKLKGSKGSTNTLRSLVTIDNKATDPSHTQTHETMHIFLNYDPSNNPSTVAEHETAGGAFKYKSVDESGKTISPTQDVNQGNVDAILKSVPELKSKTVEQK
ncbi:MAG: RHS repeat-associated core domain-containing protein, partial [Bacteroidota bacterium]|nr:RHS repeat-associated core domain-containing protein [Bacteroidota bacterium]